MQREDVERLADSLDTFAQHYPGLAKDAANALRTLLADRDAAFAAGQEEMRERAAAEISDWDLASMSGINDPEDKITDYVVATLRDLPIKGRP